MTTSPTILARDFSQLAREVAQDIFPLADLLRMHQLSDEEWAQISAHPTFTRMLDDMQRRWNAAESTPERVQLKASTGLESTLEVYIRDIFDSSIPLAQRVEAGKFLARLGGLGEKEQGQAGEKFQINITIGETRRTVDVTPTAGVIDA